MGRAKVSCGYWGPCLRAMRGHSIGVGGGSYPCGAPIFFPLLGGGAGEGLRLISVYQISGEVPDQFAEAGRLPHGPPRPLSCASNNGRPSRKACRVPGTGLPCPLLNPPWPAISPASRAGGRPFTGCLSSPTRSARPRGCWCIGSGPWASPPIRYPGAPEWWERSRGGPREGPWACGPTWTRCRSSKKPVRPSVPGTASCMPAAMTSTWPPFWVRRHS